MEQDLDAGQTDSGVAVESTTTPTGNDRLPPDGETPVRASMEGSWIIWYFHPRYNEWWPEMFYTYQSAIIRWRETGGYLCKNHTPA